ncbi:hypothetical protein [Clostridium sp.]|uniref:hypothetical protein n=1 Tax=Clostridium sp. TaxID=1506 RepID=UPI00262D0943|nr:hypothetical protein [Clostridium sp.]
MEKSQKNGLMKIFKQVIVFIIFFGIFATGFRFLRPDIKKSNEDYLNSKKEYREVEGKYIEVVNDINNKKWYIDEAKKKILEENKKLIKKLNILDKEIISQE